jgi:hypothetical protein
MHRHRPPLQREQVATFAVLCDSAMEVKATMDSSFSIVRFTENRIS